jgi:hypothetical protein
MERARGLNEVSTCERRVESLHLPSPRGFYDDSYIQLTLLCLRYALDH